MKTNLTLQFLLMLGILTAPGLANAQGTAFNYQGHLVEYGVAANDVYDFIFTIYPSAVGGAPLGAPLPLNAITVSSGQFVLPLDFGGVFSGGMRWLEIAVRINGGGAHQTLAPRQPILPTPYS